MNLSEKHDKIPEIWEGHNIADYIDPDIMQVCVPGDIVCLLLLFSLTQEIGAQLLTPLVLGPCSFCAHQEPGLCRLGPRVQPCVPPPEAGAHSFLHQTSLPVFLCWAQGASFMKDSCVWTLQSPAQPRLTPRVDPLMGLPTPQPDPPLPWSCSGTRGWPLSHLLFLNIRVSTSFSLF